MKKPLLKKVGLVLASLLTGIVAIIVLTLKFQDGYAKQKFLKEVSAIPGIKTRIISVFEGGVSAQIEIPDKGNVDVLYGILGLEYVMRIGGFDTKFICPEDQTVGVWLSLNKNSKFQKWFPFQVNNLQQLISHYDDIVAILGTFPNSPDPSYNVKTSSRPFGGNDISCSIYFKI